MNDSPAQKAAKEIIRTNYEHHQTGWGQLSTNEIADIIEQHQQPSVAALEAENERLRNDNAVLRDLAAAANPPKLSPEQLQRLRDLEQEKQP